ncbi:NAD(P)/FAD-dependent oxidoreductase [Methylocystis sp. B8]|uniref:phytoene desaturase family protein n=1 Tax=Methylocystis sp. B8 TaxID=544938 RepID=UPI0010FD6714|nr:NAD(P)/FAD-dependent oxidoreductase [Methylocystis sp. B8]TLG76818.1 NAD(P)/FAD-dependent oxidoreductase [Methylocystis sp. B8]
MHDVVIIGGGHNGLVCSAYLAMAGLKVIVLDQRSIVGGAAVTEEFSPGFSNSVASYTVSLLNPKIIRDLDLAAHGLRIIERPISNFLPLEDGRFLKVGGGQTKQQVAKFSQKDADRLGDYQARLDAVADVLRAAVLETPPNVVEGSPFAAIAELIKAGRIGNRIRALGLDLQRDFLDLFTASAGDFLDAWFESAPIKAAFGFDSIVGNFASPYAAGSAYVLLHHCFGEVNGKKGAWGHAIGGMGAITQAMAKAAVTHGVDIRLATRVRRVIVENGRAVGVKTDKGETIYAAAVAAGINPKLLYLELVDSLNLPEGFRRRMENWSCGSGTFRMNVALSELPDFTALPGRACAEHHASGIIIAPSLAYMEQAYFDARTFGWSRRPVIELVIPSTIDDSLAPRGQHVASLFCQHVAPRLPDGSSWDDHRETVADLMIDTVDNYAPNFRRSVLARQIFSPLDLERTFGLIGGDIFHGSLDLRQIFSARPMLGHADYRGPIAGLYLCGSGGHPGGGVTGAPGHNAAREILRDVRRKRVAPTLGRR